MADIEDSGEHERPYKRRSDYQIELLRRELEILAKDFHEHRAETKEAMKQTQSELAAVRSTVQMGKTAFLVLGSLGAMVAWLLSSWHSIIRLIRE